MRRERIGVRRGLISRMEGERIGAWRSRGFHSHQDMRQKTRSTKRKLGIEVGEGRHIGDLFPFLCALTEEIVRSLIRLQ